MQSRKQFLTVFLSLFGDCNEPVNLPSTGLFSCSSFFTMSSVSLRIVCVGPSTGAMLKDTFVASFYKIQMSLVVRKPVLGIFEQVPHKPGCTAIEDG